MAQELNEQSQLEDIPKETLVQILRDQLKEKKQNSRKLEKLQEKYVQVFREQKLYQKDRETLINSLSSILNEEPYKLEIKALGQFEQGVISELLSRREEEKSHALTNLIRETNNEKLQLEEKFKQMMDTSNQDQKTQALVKQLRTQISDLDNNNTRLAKEIIELNDIIQLKNSHIQSMSRIEEEYTELKTQMMLKELQVGPPDRKDRIQASDLLNEQLRMKQQIDRLLEEIQKLQALIKQQEQQISDLSKQKQIQKIQTTFEENPFAEDTPQMSFALQPSQECPAKQEVCKTDQLVQTDAVENHDHANFEYLKNVVYKYFLYHETRNYKEAQILVNAIFTLLKIPKDDRKRIEDAREKGFFKNAKNYITDNLFCMKQSQLNDINFQRPVSKMGQMNMHMN